MSFGKRGTKYYNLDIIRYGGFLQTVTVKEYKNTRTQNNEMLCELRKAINIYIYTHIYVLFICMVVKFGR